MDFARTEKEKYIKVYRGIKDYNKASLGARVIPGVLERYAYPYDIVSVLDAGCGKGDVIEYLLNERYVAYGVDITLEGLKFKAFKNRCLEAPLWDLSHLSDNNFDLVFSCDVLEHIPPEMIEQSLSELARVCKKVAYFQICLIPDSNGAKIGEKLHLSLFRTEQWYEMIKKHFSKVDIVTNAVNYAVFFCEK